MLAPGGVARKSAMLAMSCAVTILRSETADSSSSLELGLGDAERRGLGLDHAVDALAFDDARAGSR